jgi:hypothetical protein
VFPRRLDAGCARKLIDGIVPSRSRMRVMDAPA